MLTVGMDGEQHIIALIIKEPSCKFSCYAECLLIIQLVIVIGMKGNAHLVGKIAFPIGWLSEQATCEQDSIGKIIPIAVKRIIQAVRCFHHTLRDLFGVSTQDVIARPS